jgi:hypothetical protein
MSTCARFGGTELHVRAADNAEDLYVFTHEIANCSMIDWVCVQGRFTNAPKKHNPADHSPDPRSVAGKRVPSGLIAPVLHPA